MPRTLVITNDFPPRQGGIENFVYELTSRFPPDDVVVVTSRTPGGPQFDATCPFPVIRAATPVLLPTPAARRKIVQLVKAEGCDSVWFGAAAPLALLAPALRRSGGIDRIVATMHAHEEAWAQTAPGRAVLRRIGHGVDHLTYIAAHKRDAVAPALDPADLGKLVRLTPGVNLAKFIEQLDPADGVAVRRRYGLADRPVILCTGRLLAMKGQDSLLKAMPTILSRHRRAVALIVGQGPHERQLKALAEALGLRQSVRFTGGLPYDRMPAVFAAGTVFALPTRTRFGNFHVEGLPLVLLEAAAAGLPVVAGRAGGTSEAVQDRKTGFLVDGRDSGALAARLVELLDDPDQARDFGQAGRDWAKAEWSWDSRYNTLAGLLGRR